jgi:hypothetical protein
LFSFSIRVLPVPEPFGEVAAVGLVVGAVTMPLTCFLAAWRAPLRQLFPLPVTAVIGAIVSLLAGWSS